MNSYKIKYLKYKQKYIKLKNQFGGETLKDIEDKILYTDTHCINEGDYFEQHKGECWNDAIQMLLCFSDDLKVSIQNKLYNLNPTEIIDLAYLDGRSKYLAPIYRRSEEVDIQNQRAKKMEKRLYKYLDLLQNRLCLHVTYGNETDIPKCKHIIKGDDKCPLRENYGKYLINEKDKTFVFDILDSRRIEREIANSLTKEKREEMIKKLNKSQDMDYGEYRDILLEYAPSNIQLRRQQREIAGIGSAFKGLKMINRKKSVEHHGATPEEMIAIVNILSFSLLDKNNVLTTKYVNIRDLVKDDVDSSLGMIVGTPRHATSFYTCNGVDTYFNNNFGKTQVNWKKLLKEYVKRKNTHTLILYCTSSFCIYVLKKNGEHIYLIFDHEGNLNNMDFGEEGLLDWEKDIVQNLLIIKKENFETKTEDEIYNDLEEQFVLADIYNCSIANIKNLNISINNKNILDEIIYNGKYECNNIYFYELLGKINLKSLEQHTKDDFLRCLIKKEIYTDEDYKYIKLLIENKANIVYETFYSSYLFEILEKKIITDNDYEIIKLLLDNGQDINQDNTLYYAIKNKNINLFTFLINKGADVNAKIYENYNIFELLYLLKGDNIYLEFIKTLLINGVNLSEKNSYGKNLLEILIKDRYDIDLIKLFIDYGIDLNELFSDGVNPLVFIANNYNYDEYMKTLILLMINSGANIFGEGISNNILLESAIQKEHLELIELLIQKGVNLDDEINHGQKPIVNLLQSWNFNEFRKKIAMLIINSGASINIKILKNALELLDNDIAELIIKKGVKINNEIIKILIDNKNVSLLKILLENGTKPNLIIENKDTILLYISKKYTINDEHVQMVQLLIDNKADIDYKDENNKTSLLNILQYTIDKNKLKIVKLLLDAGADITATTEYGTSILDLVKDSYNQELQDLFETYFEEKRKSIEGK